LGIYKSYRPAAGTVKTGDFFRTTPFSNVFGYDRGGPIDRYYIENFLSAESEYICGRVLEIGDNEYTLRFGKENVQQSEVLHVNDSNPVATIVGDLSDAPQIADNSFDCIILTQTLHMVYDYKAVIKTCYRILKPGGTLLLTVPGITPIDYGEWGKTWLWSFTGRVMEMILAESFLKKQLEIETYGNVYVASAFLYGMGLPEIEKKVLDFHDPNMQVIITAKAVKAE
jgi:SAM-dependent methyltransferase